MSVATFCCCCCCPDLDGECCMGLLVSCGKLLQHTLLPRFAFIAATAASAVAAHCFVAAGDHHHAKCHYCKWWCCSCCYCTLPLLASDAALYAAAYNGCHSMSSGWSCCCRYLLLLCLNAAACCYCHMVAVHQRLCTVALMALLLLHADIMHGADVLCCFLHLRLYNFNPCCCSTLSANC